VRPPSLILFALCLPHLAQAQVTHGAPPPAPILIDVSSTADGEIGLTVNGHKHDLAGAGQQLARLAERFGRLDPLIIRVPTIEGFDLSEKLAAAAAETHDNVFLSLGESPPSFVRVFPEGLKMDAAPPVPPTLSQPLAVMLVLSEAKPDTVEVEGRMLSVAEAEGWLRQCAEHLGDKTPVVLVVKEQVPAAVVSAWTERVRRLHLSPHLFTKEAPAENQPRAKAGDVAFQSSSGITVSDYADNPLVNYCLKIAAFQDGYQKCKALRMDDDTLTELRLIFDNARRAAADFVDYFERNKLQRPNKLPFVVALASTLRKSGMASRSEASPPGLMDSVGSEPSKFSLEPDALAAYCTMLARAEPAATDATQSSTADASVGEARFLERVGRALSSRDENAVADLFCFDGVDEEARRRTVERTIPDLTRHDFLEASLINVLPGMADAYAGPQTDEGRPVYAPNLRPYKALQVRLRNSDTKAIENRVVLVGSKDGELAIALFAKVQGVAAGPPLPLTPPVTYTAKPPLPTGPPATDKGGDISIPPPQELIDRVQREIQTERAAGATPPASPEPFPPTNQQP
jgi:hypothetical protein